MGFFKRSRPEVVDLRERLGEPDPTIVSGPRKPVFEFGFPTRCPACGERGYLDHIDPFKRVQFEHCPACYARWEHAETEFTSINATA